MKDNSCGINRIIPNITVIIDFFLDNNRPKIPAITWKAAPAQVATNIPNASFPVIPATTKSLLVNDPTRK